MIVMPFSSSILVFWLGESAKARIGIANSKTSNKVLAYFIIKRLLYCRL